MPRRFFQWHVLPDPFGSSWWSVADENHRVVCNVQYEDDANEIVSLHNKRVREREDWYGA